MEAAFYSGRQATPEPVQPAATESSADDKELDVYKRQGSILPFKKYLFVTSDYLLTNFWKML